ncbi:MAG TPA: ATP-binding protein, partial [Tepidisphaeraceae bacterium]|nr:ATP-binding protein [Tepidisphaeraceae bacterium]
IAIALAFLAWRMLATPAVLWAVAAVVLAAALVESVARRCPARPAAPPAPAAERAQRLFESNVVGMAITDLAGAVYEANDYYLALHGYTRAELVAGLARWDSVTPPEFAAVDRQAADELRTTGFATPFEKEYCRRDGTRLPVLVYIVALPGAGDRVIALVMDVSARRQAEDAARQHRADLAHLSRVASVGEMASSLAHEINQPLAAIANYLGAATTVLDAPATGTTNGVAEATPPGPSTDLLRDAIRCAAEQAHRAADIVRRMRRFVRRGEPAAHGPIDCAAAITDALRLADPELRRAHARVDLHLAPDLPPVAGDAIEVQQVLINLLQNAVDAMAGTPEDDRVITIRASAPTPETPDAVRVTVADAGPGIPPDVAAHLFEPFLTTRPHGLGLGLAISRTIIENHGGRLTGENRPDGVTGAVFSFTLRRA